MCGTDQKIGPIKQRLGRAVRLLYLIGDFPAARRARRATDTSGARLGYKEGSNYSAPRLPLCTTCSSAFYQIRQKSLAYFLIQRLRVRRRAARARAPRAKCRLCYPVGRADFQCRWCRNLLARRLHRREYLLQKPVPAGRSHARTPAASALASRQAEKLRIRKQIGTSGYSSGRYYKYGTYCRQRKHQPGHPEAISILFVLVFDFLFNHFHSLSMNESSYELSRADH
jgi:hypothetical protein